MRHGFNSCAGKTPWKGKWRPTSVFWPEESHGQRNLTGYAPRGHKELDKTERLTLTFMASPSMLSSVYDLLGQKILDKPVKAQQSQLDTASGGSGLQIPNSVFLPLEIIAFFCLK